MANKDSLEVSVTLFQNSCGKQMNDEFFALTVTVRHLGNSLKVTCLSNGASFAIARPDIHTQTCKHFLTCIIKTLDLLNAVSLPFYLLSPCAKGIKTLLQLKVLKI